MKKISIVIGIIVIVAIGGFWYISQNSNYQQTPVSTQAPVSQQTTSAPVQAPALQRPTTQATKTVAIANFSFQSASVHVALGTMVTWTNRDSMSHTVTADDGSFDSGPIASGGTFSHTFTTIGTYAYHCAFHPAMQGSITITK